MHVKVAQISIQQFCYYKVLFDQHQRNLMAEIKFEEFQDKYKFKRELSRGGFGRVCRIEQIKTGNIYALKKLVVKNHVEADEALNEIYLMNRLQHPSIVTIYQYYNIQIKKGYGQPQRQIGMVLQHAYAALDKMMCNKQCLGTWNSLLVQVSSLIQVLALMQKQNIAHRDIKPGNILLFSSNQGEYTWKLADFGLAIDLSRAKSIDKFAGSYEYASPILRKKYKFHNLKVQTNPFKDDVYSLGVTLLQIITGSRKYTAESRNQLEEICTDKLLLKIIDMMLEESQEKRPCFKQLQTILMEQGLVKESENQPKDNNTKIKPLISKNWTEEAPAKTVNKKDIITPRIDVHNVSKGVLCVLSLDGDVMCGCDDGSVIIVRGGEAIQCGKHHKGYISQLASDEKGNIWSCGGDGNLVVWNYKYMLKSLHNSDFTMHESKIKNIFKRQSEWKVKKEIRMNPEYVQKLHTIQIPFPHQGGVSAIKCVDQQRYAIGFYDGFVFITWEGEEFHAKFHNGPVTDIKISDEKSIIFTSGYDGVVKAVKIHKNSLQIHPKIFCQNTLPIVNMQFMQIGPDECLGLLTLNGTIIYIDKNMVQTMRRKLPISNTMSGILNSDNFYAVSETGVMILDGNEEFIGKLGSRGWSSLTVIGPRQLAIGSLDGKVAQVRW